MRATPSRVPEGGRGTVQQGLPKSLCYHRVWRPIKHGKWQHVVASKVGKCQFVYTAAAAPASYFTIFAMSPEPCDYVTTFPDRRVGGCSSSPDVWEQGGALVGRRTMRAEEEDL